MQTDKDTQITYTYLRSSGTQKGESGPKVWCDTVSSPQFGSECHSSPTKKKQDLFTRVAGPWKDLVHQE